jgi:tetratricopeptide (TPR) repeat protein
MTTELTGLKVFIASPSGIEECRLAIVDEIHDFNDQHAIHDGKIIVPVRWESIPGGVGRAQELINDRVRECDYMILLLHDRWGSPTGEYSSGVEEEFSVALDCLGDGSKPMKDVLVLFKAVDEARLLDPGENLIAVQAFRQRLEGGSGIYFRDFDTDQELRQEVQRKLASWLRRDQTSCQVAVQLGLVPTQADTRPEDTAAAVAEALRLEEQGMFTLAERQYAIATAEDDAEALRMYAKFLRRRGRLQRSFEINQSLLTAARDAQGHSENADALANMGVIRRKQGQLSEARDLLREAVKSARLAEFSGRPQLSYALDNLGLVERRLGDWGQAEACFVEARNLHRELANASGEAQSLRHLSGLRQARGDSDGARSLVNEALQLEPPDRRTTAALLSQLANLDEQAGELGQAADSLKKALAINEEIGSPDGTGMTRLQLARISLESGEPGAADDEIRRAKDDFQRSNNREGLASATQAQGRVAFVQGDFERARSRLIEALEEFRSIGNGVAEAWTRRYLADALAALGLEEESNKQRELAREVASRLGVRSLLRELDPAPGT